MTIHQLVADSEQGLIVIFSYELSQQALTGVFGMKAMCIDRRFWMKLKFAKRTDRAYALSAASVESLRVDSANNCFE